MNPDDVTLALKANPSSAVLWESFYRTLFPLVVRSVLRLSGNDPETSKDVAQEAFLRFAKYRSFERVENDEHALAFLRQIARRTYFDKNGSMNFLSATEVQSGVSDMDAQVSDHWREEEASRDRIRDLEILAKRLTPDEQRQLGMLFDGEPLADIAKAFGLSYSSLVRRIAFLKHKLTE